MSAIFTAFVCIGCTVTLALLVIEILDPNEPKEGN